MGGGAVKGRKGKGGKGKGAARVGAAAAGGAAAAAPEAAGTPATPGVGAATPGAGGCWGATPACCWAACWALSSICRKFGWAAWALGGAVSRGERSQTLPAPEQQLEVEPEPEVSELAWPPADLLGRPSADGRPGGGVIEGTTLTSPHTLKMV